MSFGWRPGIPDRMPLRRCFPILCALLLGAAPGWAQGALLFDDFNGTKVDTARWKVVLPYQNTPPSTVQETNGFVELFRRGILEAQDAVSGPLDIEGRFRFVGDSDTLSIVFRSDLTVTNLAERRGVQAALQQGTGRVFLIPEPYATTPITGTYLIGKDTNVSFRVTDQGDTVRLYLQDFLQPVLSVTITNRRGSRLALYNLNGTTSRTRIDEFAVHPLRTAVFVDDTLIRTGRVERMTPARIRFQSIYTNGPVFYTLDGSAPSFLSTEYFGSFVLSNAATLRAVAYTSDFLSSSESPVVQFDYRPLVRLTNETRGGGVVTFDPAPPYASNQVVTLVAVPGPGWQFLRWEGALGGTSISNQLTLTTNTAVRAVFGTTPAITLLGSGRVVTLPEGPVFEHGTVARLQAIPDPGNYFLRWANSVTGTVSPAILVVTNGAPGVSVLFSPLATNQVPLVLRLDGPGLIGVSPPANVFTNGQSVTLTALNTEPAHVFLGWTGSVFTAGLVTTNPLRLTLTGPTSVTARFAPEVRFDPVALAFTTNGLRLAVTGVPGFVFRLEHSSNFVQWTAVETLTNVTGRLLYEHPAARSNAHGIYRVTGP